MTDSDLGRGGRRVAAILAAVWIGAGIAWPSLASSAEAQLAPTGAYSLDALHRTCIPLSRVTLGPDENAFDAASCRVSRFGRFDTLGDVVYYRAIDCLTPHRAAKEPDGGCRYHGASGLAIFVADKGAATARLLLERADPDVGLIVYDEPMIVRNRYGRLLHVKIRLDGTGAGNVSEYYRLREGAWHPIDALGWLNRFQPPEKLSIRKGVWPNLSDMTARISLYAETDGNCCPTGGTAIVTLALQGDAFVATSIRHEPAADRR